MDSVLLDRNVRAFMAFRIFFNARFYYPVFAILFLDYGLTLEQFAILNIIWAITIVLAEVPSGALADIVGRTNLIRFASIMMVLEMALLAFVPLGNGVLLFGVFVVNRICSGLAEAAASGADEAVAYDSLVALNRESEWGVILEKTSRWLSVAICSAMILGALSYDSQLMNRLGQLLGMDWEFVKQTTMRFPVYLTLGTSLVVVFNAFRLVEPPAEQGERVRGFKAVTKSFQQIGSVFQWTLNHRFVLFVILGGIILDSVARQLIILASEYYRNIGFDPSVIGFVSAGLSLLGVVYARFSRYLAEQCTPLFNFCLLSAILMIGLIGCQFLIPFVGVVFAALVFSMLSIVGYLQSFYLNRHVSSQMRATVISFKGLGLNLGLGVASFFYSLLIVSLRNQAEGVEPSVLEDWIFRESLGWFPGYYVVLFFGLVICGRLLIRNRDLLFQKG